MSGKPDNQQLTSRGETWFYCFNAGHYFIPYYFGKPRTATFHLNEAGILIDFENNVAVDEKGNLYVDNDFERVIAVC